jgi:hypothetical protein
VTGPEPRTAEARTAGGGRVGTGLGRAAARADRVLVTAHPAEPATSVVLRAGEAALASYLDDALRGGVPGGIDLEPLRRLLARRLGERLPEGAAEALHAAVTAAAVVAAVDLALDEWSARGARADDAPACRERLRAVAPLLPELPGARTDPRGRRAGGAGTASERPSRRSPHT